MRSRYFCRGQLKNNQNCQGEYYHHLSNLSDSSKTIYFIGSSRTKSSVNDEIINSKLKSPWEVINLGVASSTITQHYLLAEFLAGKKGEKIFYIELSGFRREHSSNVAVSHFLMNLPAGTSDYYASVDSIVGSGNDLSASFQQIQRAVFNRFKVAQVSLKALLGVYPKCQEHFGYKPLGQLRKSDAGPLLTPFHFGQYSKTVPSFEIESYISAFRNLENRFRNLKIYFVLPFTSYRSQEREAMIPSYLKLPDNAKVVYPAYLYRQLSNSSVLADNNHLNSKGAEFYTAFLIDYLQKNLSVIIEERKPH